MNTDQKLLDIKVTTWEELWALLAHMSREDWFFNVGWHALGRHFFSRFYGVEVWQWDYAKLLSACQSDGWTHANEGLSEEEFVKAVFKSFFWIEKLPKETKYELLCKIQKLICELTERIKEYKALCERLEKVEQKTGESEYELRLMRHYVRKSKTALQNVCDYVSHELDNEVLSMSQRGFPWMSNIHKIDILEKMVVGTDRANCNDIINKFLDYSVRVVENIKCLYDTDPAKFYMWAETELDKEILPSTLLLIRENHLLNSRAEMLEEGISLYKNKKYQVANSILALQIEGLIHDVLIANGEEEVKLSATSLTEKAERLEKLHVGFYSYEYYAFRFPVLRNEIAHGNAHKTQREEAIRVILDLCGLCRYIAKSNSLPCNRLVELTKRFLNPETTAKEKIDYARFMISNEKVSVPDFYCLQTTEADIQKEIQGQDFWVELLKCEVAENKTISDAIEEGVKIAKRFAAQSQLAAFKEGCKAKLPESQS